MTVCKSARTSRLVEDSHFVKFKILANDISGLTTPLLYGACSFNFIYTGSLDLTGLAAAAEYSYVNSTSTVIQPVTISGLDTTSVNVSGLITGFVYTFSITAENSNGLSTAYFM